MNTLVHTEAIVEARETSDEVISLLTVLQQLFGPEASGRRAVVGLHQKEPSCRRRGVRHLHRGSTAKNLQMVYQPSAMSLALITHSERYHIKYQLARGACPLVLFQFHRAECEAAQELPTFAVAYYERDVAQFEEQSMHVLFHVRQRLGSDGFELAQKLAAGFVLRIADMNHIIATVVLRHERVQSLPVLPLQVKSEVWNEPLGSGGVGLLITADEGSHSDWTINHLGHEAA